MLSIKKRIKDPAVLKAVRQLYCVCHLEGDCQGATEAHHIVTRGAGGDDSHDNVAPLCRKHHAEWHTIGIKSFVLKYDMMLTWLMTHKSDEFIERILAKGG